MFRHQLRHAGEHDDTGKAHKDPTSRLLTSDPIRFLPVSFGRTERERSNIERDVGGGGGGGGGGVVVAAVFILGNSSRFPQRKPAATGRSRYPAY